MPHAKTITRILSLAGPTIALGCSFSMETFSAGVTDGGTSADSSTNAGGGQGQGGQDMCGNGIPEDEEECDDDNKINNDGCSQDCKIDPGANCDTATPSTCRATTINELFWKPDNNSNIDGYIEISALKNLSLSEYTVTLDNNNIKIDLSKKSNQSGYFLLVAGKKVPKIDFDTLDESTYQVAPQLALLTAGSTIRLSDGNSNTVDMTIASTNAQPNETHSLTKQIEDCHQQSNSNATCLFVMCPRSPLAKNPTLLTYGCLNIYGH
jgi:cysteine-rich repeat protein